MAPELKYVLGNTCYDFWVAQNILNFVGNLIKSNHIYSLQRTDFEELKKVDFVILAQCIAQTDTFFKI